MERSDWWKGAHASSDHGIKRAIWKFDLRQEAPGAMLNLANVVLALSAVHSIFPKYGLFDNNCWWFARCTFLLLVAEARPDDWQTVYGRGTPLVNMVVGGEHLLQDVRRAQTHYTAKVRLGIVSSHGIRRSRAVLIHDPFL